MKKLLIAGASLLVIAGLLLVGFGCAGAPEGAPMPEPNYSKDILIGNSSAASGSYANIVSHAEIISRETGYNMTVLETGACIDNIMRTMAGEIYISGPDTPEFGLLAAEAKGPFEGMEPYPWMRVLYRYGTNPFYVFVREDSGITTLEQLTGKPIGVGLPASASSYAFRESTEALGIHPDWKVMSAGDQISGMQDGRIAGMMKSSGSWQLDSLILQIQAVTPIKILGYTEEQLKTCKSLNVGMYPLVIPANYLAALPMPEFRTWGFSAAIMTSPALPQDVGYEFCKAIFKNWDEMAKTWTAAKFYDDPPRAQIDWLPEPPNTPFAAGLVQYLKEQGIEVPKHLIPPEYKE